MFLLRRVQYTRPASNLIVPGSFSVTTHRRFISTRNRTSASSKSTYIPTAQDRSQPQAWLDVIKGDLVEYVARAGRKEQEENHDTLMLHVQETTSSPDSGVDEPVDFKVSRVLVEAKQYSRINLLSYLCLTTSQWAMASWMVRAITERPLQSPHTESIMGFAPVSIQNRSNLPDADNPSVIEVFNAPVWLEPPAHNLNDNSYPLILSANALPYDSGEASFTSAVGEGDFGEPSDNSVRIQATGELLNGIGAVILDASKSTDIKKSQETMTHVLDLLAILHHNGIVPDFTYQSVPSSLFADRAPPAYFDDLFQPIQSAILDAEWNLFQDSSELATYASGAQTRILGYQFPSHNNPKQILPFAHEIWLELILWICLRGGWFRSGMKILRNIRSLPPEHRWLAKSWRVAAPSSTTADWVIPSRTLSAELILGYVDAVTATTSTNQSSVTGYARDLSSELLMLKSFLDEDSVKTTDWNFLFSQSLPDYQLSLRPYKYHLAQVVSWTRQEPIEVPVQVLAHNMHRLLSVSSQVGELDLLSKLLQMIVKRVKTDNAIASAIGENTRASMSESPVYEVLSPDIVAHAVQCALDCGLHHEELRDSIKVLVGLWLNAQSYAHSSVGKVLVQYAHLQRDSFIAAKIISHPSVRLAAPIDAPDLEAAILCGQVEQGLWDFIASRIDETTFMDQVSVNWHVRFTISLATAAMRAQVQSRYALMAEAVAQEESTVMQILEKHLVQLLRNKESGKSSSAAHTVIGILATIDTSWRNSMSNVMKEVGLFERRTKVHLDAKLSQNLAAKLLTEIWHHSGTDTVRKIWHTWCEPITRSPNVDADAGQELPPMAISDDWTGNISRCEFDDHNQFIIRRKIRPNLSMLRVLVLGDRRNFRENAELRQEVVNMCSAFGVDLGSLYRGSVPSEGPRWSQQVQSQVEL